MTKVRFVKSLDLVVLARSGMFLSGLFVVRILNGDVAMNKKTALVEARESFGNHAFAEIPNRGQPTIGILVGEEQTIYGVGITFEEAFLKSGLLTKARAMAYLLYTVLGYACYTKDGRAEVGVTLYDKRVKLAEAPTFDEAFERANKTAAGAHAGEITNVCEQVARRFGLTAKVVIGETGHCFVYKGQLQIGCGNSFVLALERAIEKEHVMAQMYKKRSQANRVKYTEKDVKRTPRTEHVMIAPTVPISTETGVLELANPA